MIEKIHRAIQLATTIIKAESNRDATPKLFLNVLSKHNMLGIQKASVKHWSRARRTLRSALIGKCVEGC